MLPQPVFDTPVEPLMGSDESACEPNAYRPGVLAFKDFVLEHQGGSNGGTARPCGGSTSGHHAARAWDWMIDAYDPEQKARADELLDWLLANDAELFRRAGLAYVIWDKKAWSAFKPYWHPYDGFDDQGRCSSNCRNPHTNHVHFSFNWPGADGKTSFYRWLGTDQPVKPPPQPPPQPPPVTPPEPKPLEHITRTTLPFFAGAAVGFSAAIILARKLSDR